MITAIKEERIRGVLKLLNDKLSKEYPDRCFSVKSTVYTGVHVIVYIFELKSGERKQVTHTYRITDTNIHKHTIKPHQPSDIKVDAEIDTLLRTRCKLVVKGFVVENIELNEDEMDKVYEKTTKMVSDVVDNLSNSFPEYIYASCFSHNNDSGFNVSIMLIDGKKSVPVTHLYMVHSRGVSDQNPLDDCVGLNYYDPLLEKRLKNIWKSEAFKK